MYERTTALERECPSTTKVITYDCKRRWNAEQEAQGSRAHPPATANTDNRQMADCKGKNSVRYYVRSTQPQPHRRHPHIQSKQ